MKFANKIPTMQDLSPVSSVFTKTETAHSVKFHFDQQGLGIYFSQNTHPKIMKFGASSINISNIIQLIFHNFSTINDVFKVPWIEAQISDFQCEQGTTNWIIYIDLLLGLKLSQAQIHFFLSKFPATTLSLSIFFSTYTIANTH